MAKSIFISRELKEDDLLITAMKKSGFNIHAFSLINIERSIFTLPKFEFQWVFLASTNAANIFLPSSYEFKVGVAGPRTAKTVDTLGYEVSFVGTGGDMIEVGKLFAQEVGSANVLFPCAKGGSKKIQNQLPKNQVIDLPIYEAVAKEGIQIPDTDIVFLSSPSNAKAYISKRDLTGKTVISIGQTTKEFLNQRGVENVLVPKTPEPSSILNLILSL